ncbi:MAG: HDOD domain-containing protein [Actinobacteria bacterium]|nr:HDOD domain-containing protein [Actinomycetota bacterium]
MKKRILFVDDEVNVLMGLRRLLHSYRHEWDMGFVGSGQEALDTLANEPFDVIVTDMRMPNMDGAELLERVSRDYPHIIRIILSGHSQSEPIFRSIGPTHQFLSKPCEPEELKSIITRTSAIQDLLQNSVLKELVAQMRSLPSLPSLYLQIVDELHSEEPSIRKVGDIISNDIAMSAKILQLVNSAFFGLRRRCTSPVEASIYLGFETVKTLVLSIHIFSQFNGISIPGFSMDALWNHSMTVGSFAKLIANSARAGKKVIEDSFTAGMLHDIGKLIFVANLPEQYKDALEILNSKKIPIWQAETEMFTASHAEVGAYLLGLWGLPDFIIEAVAFHHHPDRCHHEKFSPLTTVYLANIFAHQKPESDKIAANQAVDTNYLARLNALERFESWGMMCLEVNDFVDMLSN